jgi:glycosyltransferase involved in cell wall biosynthesis
MNRWEPALTEDPGGERSLAQESFKRNSSPRRLTICGIGYAQSPHVIARLGWFAERGHKVYLITETATPATLVGITQFVPSLGERVTTSLWFRIIWRAFRHGLRINLDHVWRPLMFLRVLRRCKPDIVHVHYAYSYYAWLAGIFGCRPLVVSVMGGDILFEEQGTPTPVGKWLTINTLRRADYITSKSHHLTSVLERFGISAAKTDRILWGIPVRHFHRVDATPLRERFGIKPGELIILSPKILQPLYRIHLVVEAMPRVLQQRPNAVLLIMEYISDLDYRAEIADQIMALGLSERVHFIGNATHSEMPMFYSLADVTISVPSSDGLPQSLLESMACGTPNILSKLPRYQEFVQHRESAYFVDATPEDIAAGVVDLLNNPDLRDAIAQNALTLVQREGDLDEQAARVESRYLDLATTVRSRSFDLLNLLAVGRRYWQDRLKIKSAGRLMEEHNMARARR